jgi:hypothetical protein
VSRLGESIQKLRKGQSDSVRPPGEPLSVWRFVLALCIFAGAATGVAMLMTTGLRPRPHAPQLRNDPIYQNRNAGLRFRVPEGWIQYANADFITGQAAKERLLVAYRAPDSRAAELEVSYMDANETEILEEYLAKASNGVSQWRQVGKEESLSGAGPATRLIFAGASARDKLIKEIVAYRRGAKTFLVSGYFAPNDREAREQIRHAIETVEWR